MKNKIYYNVNIKFKGNHKIKYTSDAKFIAHFDKALLDKQSDYRMIINKMNLQNHSLPVTIPEIVPQSTVYNENIGFETNYKIFIKYNNVIYEETVYYNRNDKPNYPPTYISINNDNKYIYNNNDEYFYIYRYSDWIEIINDTINKLLNRINIQNDKIYFKLNPETSLIELYISTELLYTFEIGFNREFYKYIDGFKINSYDSKYYDRSINYKSVVLTYKNYDIIKFDDEYSIIKQEYKSLASWNIIKSIIITSNLNTNQEYIEKTPFTGLLYNQESNNINKLDSLPILLILHPIIDDNNFNNQIFYSQNNIENGDSIDLINDDSLTTLILNLYWLDGHNNIHNIRLNRDSCLNIRICFIEK